MKQERRTQQAVGLHVKTGVQAGGTSYDDLIYRMEQAIMWLEALRGDMCMMAQQANVRET